MWRKTHEFVLGVYRLNGTVSDARGIRPNAPNAKAAVSTPSIIAEGFRKRSKADKVRFLNIAEDSVEESRSYLILAQDLGYAGTVELAQLLEEVSRLLHSYADAILDSGS